MNSERLKLELVSFTYYVASFIVESLAPVFSSGGSTNRRGVIKEPGKGVWSKPGGGGKGCGQRTWKKGCAQRTIN